MTGRAAGRKKVVGVLGLILLGFSFVMAQDTMVPSTIQYRLFIKILSYDRNLTANMGKELVIGILYQSGFRTSFQAMEGFQEAVKTTEQKEFEKISVRSVAIDLDNESDLEKALSGKEIDVIYLTPLRAYEIKAIAALSRAKKMITLTGVPEYAEKGIVVGVGMKGESPEIIINLPAAREAGSDFSSSLLKLARVIENSQE
jgi:hypothetical protein